MGFQYPSSKPANNAVRNRNLRSPHRLRRPAVRQWKSFGGTTLRQAVIRFSGRSDGGQSSGGMQRFGRIGELRIADRSECGFNGRAQRTGHRSEWSGGAGSIRRCAESPDRGETIYRNKPCGTLPLSGGHAGYLFHSRATLKGFRDVQALVRVLVGNTTSQDIKLQVGASADAVKVIGTTPLLRPTESSATTVLERSFIEELPLNGRNYTDFATLTPNTSYDGDTGLVSIAGQQGGEDSGYANGNGSNAFTVDGSHATNNYFADIIGRYRIPYLYGEDAIQEFQVSVSPYSAIYGGGAGFVNSVTRSGSNAFHGSAFYYNRNSATGANDAIDKASGFPKPVDALQQFGAGVGGPILRNRLWFFVDYEQQLRNNPISVINSALATTPANLPTFLSANFGIPAGTVLPPPNGPLPVPGSDTAPESTNPVYLQQVSNTVNALNSNLGTKARQRNDWVITPRLDYQPTSRDGLFLSLNLNRFNSPGGVITDPTVGNYGTQTLANAYVHTFQASLGWTHTFSSNLLNEFHVGTSQDNQISTPTGLAPNTPTLILDSPAAFILGNAPFSVGRVFERQYSRVRPGRLRDRQAHLAIRFRYEPRLGCG